MTGERTYIPNRSIKALKYENVTFGTLTEKKICCLIFKYFPPDLSNNTNVNSHLPVYFYYYRLDIRFIYFGNVLPLQYYLAGVFRYSVFFFASPIKVYNFTKHVFCLENKC